MKRILFIQDIKKGGAYESLMQISNSLGQEFDLYFCFKSSKKFQSSSINNSYELNIRNWINYMGGNSKTKFLIKLPGIVLLQIFTIIKLMRIIKEKKIDVVHTNSRYYLEGAIAAKLLSVKHIWSIRELVLNNNYYKSNIVRNFIFTTIINGFSDTVLCNSNAALEQLLKIGIKEYKIKKIFNLVKVVKKENQKQIKHLLPTQFKDRIIVAIIGWISPIKRVEVFLNLAAEFKNSRVLFVIIGEHTKRDEAYYLSIKNRADSLRNIEMIGYIDRIVDYIGSIDILIHCCDCESFGRVVAEAQLNNVPAIVFKGSAVSELVVDQVTGYVVDNFSDLKHKLNLHIDYMIDNKKPESFNNIENYMNHLDNLKLIQQYRDIY